MKILSICLILSVFLLTSCADTSGTTVRFDHNNEHVDMIQANPRVKRWVKITNVSYDTVNNLKRVHITVESTRNKRLRLDYRINWFNDLGVEIDPDSRPYNRLILEGKDSRTLTSIANNVNGVTSKFRIRDASESE